MFLKITHNQKKRVGAVRTNLAVKVMKIKPHCLHLALLWHDHSIKTALQILVALTIEMLCVR